SLATSMVGESQPISIDVVSDEGNIRSSSAVSIGLIITELLINTVKYAFPIQRIGAAVLVRFDMDGSDWKLTVSDNGIGKSTDAELKQGGLGTTIVRSLVKQLDAIMDIRSSAHGLSVAISHTSAGSLKLAS